MRTPIYIFKCQQHTQMPGPGHNIGNFYELSVCAHGWTSTWIHNACVYVFLYRLALSPSLSFQSGKNTVTQYQKYGCSWILSNSLISFLSSSVVCSRCFDWSSPHYLSVSAGLRIQIALFDCLQLLFQAHCLFIYSMYNHLYWWLLYAWLFRSIFIDKHSSTLRKATRVGCTLVYIHIYYNVYDWFIVSNSPSCFAFSCFFSVSLHFFDSVCVYIEQNCFGRKRNNTATVVWLMKQYRLVELNLSNAHCR